VINWSFILYLIPIVLVALIAQFIIRKRRPHGHKEGEVKHCVYCGAAIGASREFCGKCGKKQPTYGHLPPKL